MLALERWRAVEDLYHATLARGEPQRAEFLAQACGSDDALRREVEALLAHDSVGEFLEPIPVSNGTLIGGAPSRSLIGQRFLVIRRRSEISDMPIAVVMNWWAELVAPGR